MAQEFRKMPVQLIYNLVKYIFVTCNERYINNVYIIYFVHLIILKMKTIFKIILCIAENALNKPGVFIHEASRI